MYLSFCRQPAFLILSSSASQNKRMHHIFPKEDAHRHGRPASVEQHGYFCGRPGWRREHRDQRRRPGDACTTPTHEAAPAAGPPSCGPNPGRGQQLALGRLVGVSRRSLVVLGQRRRRLVGRLAVVVAAAAAAAAAGTGVVVDDHVGAAGDAGAGPGELRDRRRCFQYE